jgi:hypothetical protein
MGVAGDYSREMTALDQIDDATAEALLSGRPVPPALEPLAAVMASYRRVVVDQPVPPSPELAAWLVEGGLPRTAAPGRPVVGGGTGNGRGHRVPAGKRRRRRRMPAAEVLAGVAAKLAGMSAAAKALAGIAVATAGIGTAGLTGTLPDPAQEKFETVLETVSPVEFGEPARDEHADFGERVSEDARDGGVDGGEISEEARQQGERNRPAELPAQVPDDPGKPSELPTPDQTGQPGPPEAPPGEELRPTAPPGR